MNRIALKLSIIKTLKIACLILFLIIFTDVIINIAKNIINPPFLDTSIHYSFTDQQTTGQQTDSGNVDRDKPYICTHSNDNTYPCTIYEMINQYFFYGGVLSFIMFLLMAFLLWPYNIIMITAALTLTYYFYKKSKNSKL